MVAPGRPGLALAAVLIQLVGALGGYAHLALVEHERCPEHGELVHANEGQAGAHQPAAPAELPADGSSRLGAADPGDDEHDACAVVASLRKRGISCQSPSDGLAVARAEGPSPLPSSPASPRERALFLLAPKNSPPSSRG